MENQELPSYSQSPQQNLFWEKFLGVTLVIVVLSLIGLVCFFWFRNTTKNATIELTQSEPINTEQTEVPSGNKNVAADSSSSEFDTWERYSYPSREFSAKFPSKPEITVLPKPKDTDAPIDTIETIETTVGKYKYSVDYIDLQPSAYKPGFTIAQKEQVGVFLYSMMLQLAYSFNSGFDKNESTAPALNGHLTKSFTITSPQVTFVGRITAIDGKVYAYSTQCTGADCSTVPFQKEFLNSFALIED